MVFVDLTKAFDTVNCNGLWKILCRFGCPEKLVSLVESFHNGMWAGVQENGKMSETFSVRNGVKKGCVLTLTLFSLLFTAMLTDAFEVFDRGVYLHISSDGKFFNL